MDRDQSSNGEADDASLGALEPGMWGGRGIRLVVTESRIEIEFDCARGVIDGPIVPDAEGNFTVVGEYTPELGGPVTANDPKPTPRSADYTGWTDGETMRITITVTETEGDFGSFDLQKDKQALLDKCA